MVKFNAAAAAALADAPAAAHDGGDADAVESPSGGSNNNNNNNNLRHVTSGRGGGTNNDDDTRLYNQILHHEFVPQYHHAAEKNGDTKAAERKVVTNHSLQRLRECGFDIFRNKVTQFLRDQASKERAFEEHKPAARKDNLALEMGEFTEHGSSVLESEFLLQYLKEMRKDPTKGDTNGVVNKAFDRLTAKLGSDWWKSVSMSDADAKKKIDTFLKDAAKKCDSYYVIAGPSKEKPKLRSELVYAYVLETEFSKRFLEANGETDKDGVVDDAFVRLTEALKLCFFKLTKKGLEQMAQEAATGKIKRFLNNTAESLEIYNKHKEKERVRAVRWTAEVAKAFTKQYWDTNEEKKRKDIVEEAWEDAQGQKVHFPGGKAELLKIFKAERPVAVCDTHAESSNDAATGEDTGSSPRTGNGPADVREIDVVGHLLGLLGYCQDESQRPLWEQRRRHLEQCSNPLCRCFRSREWLGHYYVCRGACPHGVCDSVRRLIHEQQRLVGNRRSVSSPHAAFADPDADHRPAKRQSCSGSVADGAKAARGNVGSPPMQPASLPPAEQGEAHTHGLLLPQEKLKEKCLAILEKLLDHDEDSWLFNEPVDPETINMPDYRDIITQPMDLGTVRTNVENGVYNDFQAFSADVKLTFDNAMTYNKEGDHKIYDIASKLKSKFDKEMKALMSQLEQERQQMAGVQHHQQR